jgi:hypothetical protein
MKIRVISSKDEIETLINDGDIVHIAFRPSNKDIFSVVGKCPNVKALHFPSSYIKTISGSTQMYLSMQDIDLLEGGVWGHRKDINNYYEISKSVFDRIKEYRSEGLSEEKIVDKMAKDTRLGSDFIEFIMKQV